jgi:hypothetical protein
MRLFVADDLKVRELEMMRQLGGPVNWRTTKTITEMRNWECEQTTGFYKEKDFRDWMGLRN